VFDKQGKFVEGLKPEQFQLKVNGQPVPISFFELVTTGSAQEKAQLEAARRSQPATVMGEKPPVTITPPAGRSIFIFVDDFHLDGESLIRTRKTLVNTIDKEITANDRALVTAASGQLGVQRLTTDKDALKATVARITPRAGIRQISQKPTMTEYAAIAIKRDDHQVIDYYVEYEVKINHLTRDDALEVVKGRADTILDHASTVTAATLSSLESFARELSGVPGRKLLFFLSDGFVIENERSISYQRLRSATQEAAQAGVVIYALNTRGLVAGGFDASEGEGFDARLVNAVYGANSNSQDVLYSLAADTGGTALVNNNDLNVGVRKALEDTSKYYLLAWRPSQDNAKGENIKRIDLTIAGRPDLKVKARRFLAESVSSALAASSAPGSAPSSLAPNAALMAALNSDAVQTGIPASLVLVHRNTGGANWTLTTSLQVPTNALSFADVNGKSMATLDLAGVVLDKAGKQIATFNKTVGVAPDANVIDPNRKLLFYNYEFNLPPGNYRVRLGLRDEKSGLIGSTSQTVEIPETANGKLALSSLLLNEQLEADEEETPSEKTGARKGVTQRFARNAHLRFLTYIYNAKPVADNDNEPDLDVDVKILRGNQPMLKPALRPIEIESKDTRSFPYAAEIPLDGLQPGEYTLLVTVTDQTTKASSSQRAAFVVE
jgi:VWFA-related protein